MNDINKIDKALATLIKIFKNTWITIIKNETDNITTDPAAINKKILLLLLCSWHTRNGPISQKLKTIKTQPILNR